jgi:serine/threonine protein kinase
MNNLQQLLERGLAGRYQLERELGEGGMAVVFLAQDLRHDRKVALKVLRPDLSAAIGPERFLREIKLAAGLTHPHILPVYDSGEAGGLPLLRDAQHGRALAAGAARARASASPGGRAGHHP